MDALVAKLYLSVLSRHPTAQETAFAVNYLRAGNREPAGLQPDVGALQQDRLLLQLLGRARLP